LFPYARHKVASYGLIGFAYLIGYGMGRTLVASKLGDYKYAVYLVNNKGAIVSGEMPFDPQVE